MTKQATTKQQRLANLLGALALSVNDAVAAALAQNGAGYGSDSFALVLVSQNQRLRCDQLAHELQLAPSSVARLVDRLEADGLLRRHAGEDRRTVWVALTAKGNRQVERVLAARAQPLQELVKQLSASEQDNFCLLTEKLLTALTPDAVSAARNCRLCDERACHLARCPVERCSRQYAQGA